MSTDKMTPPTPAAVRCALAQDGDVVTPGELLASVADKRPESQVLRDHIHAIAQEMRKESEEWYAASMKHGGNQAMTDHANDLEKFADKLEGKQS